MNDYRFDKVAENITSKEVMELKTKLYEAGYYDHQIYQKISGGTYPNFKYTVVVEVLATAPKVEV